jgi:hypothetical protein
LIEVTTDTATICIYDVACLRHRKDDVGDWWSIPANELHEIRLGNALFLNLGSDGHYSVEIANQPVVGVPYNLKVVSGQMFIGPGEETTGGGFEPDGSWGGTFIEMATGSYQCTIRRSDNHITLRFDPTSVAQNDIDDLIRI